MLYKKRPQPFFVRPQFEDNIKPINIELSKKNKVVTHENILTALKTRDYNLLREALEGHFEVYTEFIKRYGEQNE